MNLQRDPVTTSLISPSAARRDAAYWRACDLYGAVNKFTVAQRATHAAFAMTFTCLWG